MSKVCYTCKGEKAKSFTVFRDGKRTETVQLGDTDKKIPKWYKEAGIYSPLAPQITCNPKYNWFLERSLGEILPVSYQHSLTFNIFELVKTIPMNIDPSDTWLAYWGSSGRDFNCPEPVGPIEAYGTFHNSGLSRVQTDGYVTLYYDPPTPYVVEGILYPPHIHFTLLKKDKTWRLNQTTLDIIPDIELPTFMELLHNHKYLVVNSLPEKNRQDIPGSHRIPYNSTANQAKRKLKKMTQSKYTPIIVYCNDSECQASSQLMKTMLSIGYNNLIHFPGGIKEYSQNKQVE